MAVSRPLVSDLSLRAQLALAAYRYGYGLAGLAMAGAVPWLANYSRRVREGFGDYLGQVPRSQGGQVFWVHAVSMGESLVAYGLTSGLQREFPGCHIVFTSTHPDVIAGARRRGLKAAYFPLDTQVCMRRVFERWKPTAVFVCETDFWPEFSMQCHNRNLPLFLVNGRISEKIAAFYQNFSGLAELVFSAYRMLAVQTLADADRLRAIGVDAQRLVVLGNMKADLTVVPGSIDLSAIRAWIGERTTLVFGSLHPPEFRLLQSVIRAQAKRGHAIILAPRNPKFAEEWQRALTSAGITCCRRSVGLVAQTSVMLLDSMGELASLYELADSAFVGGSLVGDVGGHNPLEVIQQSVPLLMGPECRNFADLVDELKKSEAMQSCIDADAVALAIDRLLSDRAFARSMVERATRVLEANRGALANTLMMIKDCLSARQ